MMIIIMIILMTVKTNPMNFMLKMLASVVIKQVYDDDDEKFFMQTLRDFMRKNNQPLGKLPALGFKKGTTLEVVILNY